ncbi:hypothetical protein [Streptomyces hirsutus]|uniref:hypothetical protein n=1 Tax=Streptomyces hirsutus TaxID=35620 RepID=UPI00366612D2
MSFAMPFDSDARENEFMKPEDFRAAWEHPPTRRSYVQHLLTSLVGLLAWTAVWLGLLYMLIVHLSPEFAFLFALPLGYCFYRAVVQLSYFSLALRMWRILRTYPWRIFREVPHGLTNHAEVSCKHYGWFEFPNPALPAHRMPLVFPRHHRTEWWHRRMAPHARTALKADIETIWFVGDPRFIGLIAATGRDGTAPRRLHILEQWMALQEGQRSREWGVTAEDVERGRRVGIHLAHP